MNRHMLAKEIWQKQRELSCLVENKRSLRDREVYQKSLELDQLVVRYLQVKEKSDVAHN